MSSEIFQSLIRLLDDPDEDVYASVKDKLLEYGTSALTHLESAWENNNHQLTQTRAEEIIHQIHLNDHLNKLNQWIKTPQKNLVDAWIILTQHRFPNFDGTLYSEQLSLLADEAKQSIELTDSDFEKVAAFNHFLFNEKGFKGNTNNYHSPNNSCLNYVMDNRKGNPLSLSIIYLHLSKQIGLPVCGVNMPRHFIVGFENDMFGDPIKFYINPFSKGTILSRQDLEHFLQKEKIKEETKYFSPCGHVEIVKRMINNLLYSYTFKGDQEKTNELIKFLQLFKSY